MTIQWSSSVSARSTARPRSESGGAITSLAQFGGGVRSPASLAAPTQPRAVERIPKLFFMARFSALWRDPLEVFQALHGILLPQQAVIDAAGVERAPCLVRVLIEVGKKLLDLPLDGHQQPHLLRDELDASPPSSNPRS